MAIRDPTTSANGFDLVASTTSWNIWARTEFWKQYRSHFTDSAVGWLDASLARLSSDFAYSRTTQGGTSWEPVRMDCVLDPGAQGGAHTGSVFGSNGVSVSPDALYNSAYGIPQFWWHVLTMHETVNVLTGSIASSWVWADGSPLWAGGSPFPNMCDIVVSSEIGRKDVSAAQLSRMEADPGVRLFLGIQQRYGWGLYRKLFSYVVMNEIRDWSVYSEPLRSAILIWFLSYGANLTTTSTDELLLKEFNSALQSISGHLVPSSAYARAQALFPRPDVPRLY
jgi:hypothetical protein